MKEDWMQQTRQANRQQTTSKIDEQFDVLA